MDITKLLQDYSVMTASQGHKHNREGWVNVDCPFCSGDPGYHLGFNIQNSYAVCWRCGHVPLQKGIAGVLGVSYKKAKELIKEYKGVGYQPKPKIRVQKHAFKTPNTYSITPNSMGYQYMINRGFTKHEIGRLITDFGLMECGPVCSFKMNDKPVNLKFRIFAPIYYEGNMVSWQTRDITGNSALKYLTCPKSVEKVEHKKLIYTQNIFSFPDTIVLCEGIFDVWKVHLSGYFAGCGFGVDLTIDQIYYLKHNFKRIIIFLDPDTAGARKGKELYSQLSFAGVKCHLIKSKYKTDPGDMSIKQIKVTLNRFYPELWDSNSEEPPPGYIPPETEVGGFFIEDN